MGMFDGGVSEVNLMQLQQRVAKLERGLSNLPARWPVNSTSGCTIYRMKVKALEIEGKPELVYANLWDGTTLGTRDYIVRAEGKSVDDEILVARPDGGTDQTFLGKPVVWADVSGGAGSPLPVPTAVHQVLQCTLFNFSTDYILNFDFVPFANP
jgi:hypothetical protein